MGVTALVLGGCDVPSQAPVAVVDIVQVSETVLEMHVASCDGSPSASVTEGESEDGAIHVFVVATVQDAGNACLDAVLVELESPLAGRAVVDDFVAGEVAVEPLVAP